MHGVAVVHQHLPQTIHNLFQEYEFPLLAIVILMTLNILGQVLTILTDGNRQPLIVTIVVFEDQFHDGFYGYLERH